MASLATGTSHARHVGRGFAPIDRDAVTAAGLGVFLVMSVGLTDGGYYGRASSALTVACASAAALGAIHGGRPSRGGLLALAVLGALAAWTALSVTWAAPGALVEGEARRAILYTSALAALLLVVGRPGRRALLLGLVGSITLLGVVAISMRAASGAVVDRFYGTLLEEPVGYPNALGALAALGIVIAVGLALSDRAGSALRGSAALLVLVLGLTGSRGAALALGTGLCALVALGPSAARLHTTLRALVPLLVGGAAWAAVVASNAADGLLVVLAVGTWVSGALVPDPAKAPRRQSLVAVGCLALVALVAGAGLRPVATTSSFRTTYWRVALAPLSVNLV